MNKEQRQKTKESRAKSQEHRQKNQVPGQKNQDRIYRRLIFINFYVRLIYSLYINESIIFLKRLLCEIIVLSIRTHQIHRI